MKQLAIIVTLCVGCCLAAGAQGTFTERLQKSNAGEGKVTVTQDKAIDELVNGPSSESYRAGSNGRVVRAEGEANGPKVVQSTVTSQPATPKQTVAPVTSQKEENKSTTQPTPADEKRPVVTDRPETMPDTTYTEETRKKVMKGYKVNGYRVQVYAGGNSRDSRQKAEKTGKEINSLFPGEPVYVHFYSPRWICRMGNYRTYEEAHQILNAVKKMGYQSAIIVKGKITVPYQTTPEQ